MGGTTKRMSTTPREAMPLRNSLFDAFQSGNIGPQFAANLGNNTYNTSTMNAGRALSGGSVFDRIKAGQMPGFGGMPMGGMGGGATPNFLDMLNSGIFSQGPSLDSFADPNGALFTSTRQGYEDMFNQNRAEGLAQAKEASGNLTGSGYAANLGGVVNRSLGEQNALMSQVLTQLATAQYGQENANAQNNSQRFLALLSMLAGGGVGPDAIVQSGGAGGLLGPIATGIGYGLGGPAGGFLGGLFGRGGGATP